MKPTGIFLAAFFASLAMAATAATVANAQPPARPADAAAPATAAAAEPRPASTLPWSRIEQLRRGNRVVEITVVSAAGERRYTMVNREGAMPLSSQELSSGLSTPRFFKLEF